MRAQNARMRRPQELPRHLLSQPFTVAQARAAGLTRRRTRATDLVSPCHGVRAAAAAGDGLLERARALTGVTGAVVSHASAALLWGFPLPAAGQYLVIIHLTVQPGQRAVRRKGVVGHQQTLQPEEVTPGRHVACTSPLRTWFDLAGILSLDDLVIAGDFLLRRRFPLTTPRELDAYLDGKRGVPGYRRARRARALIRADTDSPKETELRLLLLRHGLPEPCVNTPIFDQYGGWIQDPDMSYEAEKVAIQYDGGHHATPEQRRSDIFRDENAKDAGWRVVVLTQWDLTPFAPGMEPTAVTRVRAALRERGWTPAKAPIPIHSRRRRPDEPLPAPPK
jgi:very-short-patch-repair endonuclease